MEKPWERKFSEWYRSTILRMISVNNSPNDIGQQFSEWYRSTTTFKTINNHKCGGFKGKHFLWMYIGPLHCCNMVVEIHKFMNHCVTVPALIALFLSMFFRRVSIVAAHHPSTWPLFFFLGGWLPLRHRT